MANSCHNKKDGRFCSGKGQLRTAKRKAGRYPVKGASDMTEVIDASGKKFIEYEMSAAQLRSVEHDMDAIGRHGVADVARRQRKPKLVK